MENSFNWNQFFSELFGAATSILPGVLNGGGGTPPVYNPSAPPPVNSGGMSRPMIYILIGLGVLILMKK